MYKKLFPIILLIVCFTSFSSAYARSIDEKLLYAVAVNKTDLCKKAISAGANVNYKKLNHHTPLTLAVKNKHLNIASLLIDNNADPNLAMENSSTLETPLIIAVHNNDLKMVKLLIKSGAKANIPRKIKNVLDEFTPLMLAIQKDEGDLADLDMVNLLLENGAKVNYATHSGYTPLMATADYKWMNPEERLLIAKRLLKAGADPNARDSKGLTALNYAYEKRFTKMVDLLTPLMQTDSI